MPFLRPLILITAVLFVTLSGPASADFSADISGLTAKKSKAKIAAVEKLAASGHPRAVAVLRAFLEGRLYIQKKGGKPAIVKKSGRDFETFDPESGDPLGVAPKKSLKKVRINNRLRKVVKGALGGLTLLSPYREKRAEAAKAVFKDRQAAMLPMLEKALAKETDTTARNEMTRALAAIQATRLKDTERRVAALEVLATYTDQDVRALVAGLLTTDAQGKPLESDQKVREAAGNALKVIEDRLQLWGFAASIFQGVSLGSVLLLAAMGLGIVNKFLESVSGAVLAKILVLIAIILFIQRRPRGLFALRGRAVEA